MGIGIILPMRGKHTYFESIAGQKSTAPCHKIVANRTDKLGKILLKSFPTAVIQLSVGGDKKTP